MDNKIIALEMIKAVPVHRVEQETVVIRATQCIDRDNRHMPIDHVKEYIKKDLMAHISQHIRWDIATNESGVDFVFGTVYLAVRKE